MSTEKPDNMEMNPGEPTKQPQRANNTPPAPTIKVTFTGNADIDKKYQPIFLKVDALMLALNENHKRVRIATSTVDEQTTADNACIAKVRDLVLRLLHITETKVFEYIYREYVKNHATGTSIGNVLRGIGPIQEVQSPDAVYMSNFFGVLEQLYDMQYNKGKFTAKFTAIARQNGFPNDAFIAFVRERVERK